MGEKGISLPSAGRMHIGRASGSIGSGRFRLFASLGRGGMADVLLGVANGPAGFNKLVVVKRLRPMLADDPAVTAMFLDEARLAARMSHPNVIHTYEIGEGNGAYFIAMEYLEGQPLHEVLHALKSSGKAVRPAVWARIVRDALAGLHYAHELTDYDGTKLDVVHRDVSPQNIIVTYDGGVKLCDFGIAKASVNTTRTESGIIKGKLAYMAPEQVEPELGLDRRADIFAAGIVLWECVTMRRLITGDAQSAMSKIVDMELSAPSRVNATIPPALDRIVMRALERNPDRRFQTAQEMREALDAYLRDEGGVGDEELGELVSSLFKGERADMRAEIHRHLKTAVVTEESPEARDGDSVPPAGRDTLEPPGMPLTDSGRSVRAVHRSNRPLHTKHGMRASVAAAVAVPLLAGAALVVAGQRSSHRHPSATAASAPVASPVEVPPAPTRRAVHVRVAASPPDATLYLDDVPLPANPYVGDLPVDGLDHRVSASRSGYVADARVVRLDGADVALEIDLARAAAPAESARAVPRRAAADARDAGRPALDDDPWR